MSDDLFQLLKAWLGNSWTLIESFTIPGTSLSLGAVLLGSAIAAVSVSLLGKVFGSFRGGSQRGGNNEKIRVKEERKGDTK